MDHSQAKDMYLKTLDKSLSCSDGREYVLRNYLEQIPEHAEVFNTKKLK